MHQLVYTAQLCSKVSTLTSSDAWLPVLLCSQYSYYTDNHDYLRYLYQLLLDFMSAWLFIHFAFTGGHGVKFTHLYNGWCGLD